MPLTQFQILNEALSRKCLTTLDYCLPVLPYAHCQHKMCLSAFPFCQYAHLLLFIMNNADSVLQIRLTNHQHHQHPKIRLFSVKSATDLFKNIHQSPYTTFSIAMHYKGEGGEIWFVTSCVFHSRAHNIHAGTKLVLASMRLHSGFRDPNFKTICYSLPGQSLFRMKQT